MTSIADSEKSPGLGTLYIVSAPSGAGKSSLVKALVDSVPDVQVSISHTTRLRRPGEEDGVHYNFVDNAEFEDMLSKDLFLEHAEVFDHYYGTSVAWVMDTLQQGIDVILEIDWQGARQVRDRFADYVSIFILPPSLDILEKRLRSREQDNEATIARRMHAAVSELEHYDEFDYLILNDDFNQALEQLSSLVLARRQGNEVQMDDLTPIMAKLLP
jgi:guanylate kinase